MKWLKNKKLLCSGVILFAAMTIGGLWLTNRPVTPLRERGNKSVSIAAPFGTPPQSPVSSRPDVRSPEQVNAKRMAEVDKMLNTPIVFFGKVVDQEGRPISGAESQFILVDSFSFSGHPTEQGPFSDESGRFEITGKRGALLSVKVQHPDYRAEDNGYKKVEFAYANRKDMRIPVKLPTVNDPCTFVLTRKNPAENLIHHKEIRTRLSMDGTPIAVNFRSGKIEDGKESVTLSLLSSGASVPRGLYKPYDWKAVLSVPNGGLVGRDSTVSFMAPEQGYVSEIVIDRPSNMSRWDLAAELDLYVRFSTGTIGRLKVNIAGKGMCRISTWLNPKLGSRNLEYDKDKAIQP